jgi:hypothetical protein
MTDGAVVSLWRYPVKSMMGEELNASDLTDRGLLGDRSLALVDTETGKVVSAKNPRKWATMFDCRAVFTKPPGAGEPAATGAGGTPRRRQRHLRQRPLRGAPHPRARQTSDAGHRRTV